MNSVLTQLNHWRLRERALTFAWGAARWATVVALVLAVACAADWAIDRYSGSPGWRKAVRWTGVLAADPLAVGHTPFGVRFLMTAAQVALAGALAYYLVVRPWRTTPHIDDLALRAERAHPEFDHRLVTALQLNRPSADTRGMSQALIADVTREAGEIAAKHDFGKLVDYRRLKLAAAVLVPALVVWGAFAAVNAPLAAILVQRQALLKVEIPRDTRLENRTPEVFPTGAEVTVRYAASGKFTPNSVGTLVVVPTGQPAEFYELTNEKGADGAPTDIFSVKLPASSIDFSFQARLEDGRTDEASKVRFESPPQLARDDPSRPPLTAEQVLPAYLGTRPGGQPYFRKNDGWTRGEVIDALPRSTIIVEALFNKPVATATLVPIVRGDGLTERELPPVAPAEVGKDRQSASFVVPAVSRMIGYRIDLTDSYGFTNPTPIRRNVRMWDDRPPVVDFKPESTRNPNPETFDGTGNPKDYEFDMALAPDGLIMVTYAARSEVGVRAANVRFRVIPKGVQFDLYPEEYRAIQHPRDDPNLIVYDRLPLTRFVPPKNADLGPFVPDLGLFAYSFTRTVEVLGFEFQMDVVPRNNRNRVNVQFYPFPSRDPAEEPGELEAGGRYNFEIAGLQKKYPEVQSDGKIVLKRAKLEVGDTVEVYVEVFDKLPVVDAKGKPIMGEDGKPLPPRPAGYTREARRKIVVTEADAAVALLARDESRMKLRDKVNELARDQFEVFKPKKK
jgi:hypothetical protein